MDLETAFIFMMEDDTEDMLVFIMEQLTVKQGLKQFGTTGAAAIMTELEQLVYRKVWNGAILMI